VPPRIQTEFPTELADLLPDRFRQWFAGRGWTPREHQLELLAKARDDRSALLIAPTGAGKTLAGFLPTLVELSAHARASPLPPRSGGVRGEQSSLSRSGVGGVSASSRSKA
jgi:ATP-dependent Lhr-like helicase